MFRKAIGILLCLSLCISAAACNGGAGETDGSGGSDSAGAGLSDSVSSPGASSPDEEKYAYREDRDFTAPPLPDDEIDESGLPAAAEGSLGDRTMTDGGYTLSFEGADGWSVGLYSPDGVLLFGEELPAKLYVNSGGAQAVEAKYDGVEQKSYGFLATAHLTSEAGSQFTVEDRYYFPAEGEEGVFNVARTVTAESVAGKDSGFESVYTLSSAAGNTGDYDWFIPNNEFGGMNYGTFTYRETYLGVPMIMMRNRDTGAMLSLSRYQPVIHYENNSYASLTAVNGENAGSVSVEYPSRDTARKYHEAEAGAKHSLTLSIRVDEEDTQSAATVAAYNAHFNLQNQRIVNTDIDEVYKVINEDYKVFLQETRQTNAETGKSYISYGLPWRITIEDGEFGPLTYQAGFIGQQLPSAYNMMLYGVMNDDLESLQNGVNVVDFWVSGAEFMTIVGLPYIWYDTWADGFRSYPCFLRMAVDAMEGVLDAYRLAEAHEINRPEWYDAVIAFADFLVNYQNDDGSWYRCYNYDGGPFRNWDNGIEEPAGNICQSESKLNTNLPVRFLAKVYEMTGKEAYREAAIAAGEFVYKNIYPTGVYTGGTCDNPNRVDKESGVYAMYCYDALYMLTGEARWLECLKQATAFTMSTVQIFSYPVRDSALKAAYPCEYGYNDGMSFICCNSTGADNYIAFIYYELFRVYILTGEYTYLRQAEFIQQNTKSIMNWDGALGYAYKSLVAEASTTAGFTFDSASDGAWVTWSSVANAEPIAKMYTNFGSADVMDYAETPLEELRQILQQTGVGGYAHRYYENTVASQVQYEI